MDHFDLDFEKTLADSEALLKNTARSIDDDAALSLDSILAEFGGGLPETPASAEAGEEPAMLEDADEDAPECSAQDVDAAQATPPSPAPADDAPQSAQEPPLPQPAAAEETGVSLQDVLEKTVQTVLTEQQSEPVLEPPQRRGLFSRRRQRDTEELYDRAARREEPEEDEPPAPERPEPPLCDAAASYRGAFAAARRAQRVAALLVLLMWTPLVLDSFSLLPAAYAQNPLFNTLPYLALEALACGFSYRVFIDAFHALGKKTVSCEVLTALSCLVTMGDAALAFFLPARAALLPSAAPYHAVAVLSLFAVLHGRCLRLRGMYDTFRVAAIGDAPYMVTVTAGGAAKRSGTSVGFFNCAEREDSAHRWQRVLLPVILMATLIFAVLSTVEAQTPVLFLWNFSVLLCGANALAFPLVYGLALRKLAARLVKSGSAIAGFAGADEIRRSNCVILTDGDLFPPGTVTLNGLKTFGEESGRVISYAATMARASESGLSRLFDNLLQSDGGTVQPVDELTFYEEGGVGGTIRGEAVLFGTLPMFRKRGISLPRDLKLQTGVYLAVDNALIAVFAVKYMAAENVDWAVHALHRSRITPVLAVRDGNVTPALLKRKFGTDARAVFPKLSTRLALSERGGGRPYALLFREGLMPYAEVTLGSKRLCRAVRIGSRLSLLGSIVGTLLAFYLTFVGAYSALAPRSMLVFSLLWALAALIDAIFVDRY